MDLSPYILLTKSRLPPSTLAPVSFSLCVVLALIPASVLAQSGWLVFTGHLALSVLSMLATALSVYLYNDIIDIEIDRVNRLDRPLVTGEASKENARNLAIFLGAIGLITAFTINLQFLLLMLMYFALFFLYSFPRTRLKKRFLIKDSTIATATAITYLMGGSAVGNTPAYVYLMATFGFLSAMSSNMLKDLGDIEGDRIHKVKTLPIVWGPSITIKLAMALVFLAGIATVIGFLHLGFPMAFAVLAVCASTAWIYVLYPLLHHYSELSYLANSHSLVIKTAPIGFFLLTLTMVGAVLKLLSG